MTSSLLCQGTETQPLNKAQAALVPRFAAFGANCEANAFTSNGNKCVSLDFKVGLLGTHGRFHYRVTPLIGNIL